MLNKTRAGRKACLDHLLGQNAMAFPSAVYLSLHNGDPTDFGLLTDEFDADGYARMRIDNVLDDAIIDSGQISNAGAISSANPDEDWPEVTHHGISHSLDGALLYSGPTVASRIVEKDDPYLIEPYCFVCAELGEKTRYLRKAWLDHVFGRGAYAFPANLWLALFTADPTEAGSLGDELSGGGYARVDIIAKLSEADLSTGETTNSAVIAFSPATADWPSVTHIGLVDSSAPGFGNLLYFGAASTPRTVLIDDYYRLKIGQLTISER